MADESGKIGGGISGAIGGTQAGFAVGGGVGAAVGGVLGGVAGMFGGGGGESESGYSIPPEYELQFLEEFKNQLMQMQQEYGKLQESYKAYTTKINAFDSIVGGGNKQQALKAVQQSNYRIASLLGGDAESLVKSGFLDAADKADLDEMKAMLGQQFKDPSLENDIVNQRARLEQDLRRQGASPAAISQELSRFDRSAEEMRFNRSEELKNTRLGQTSGLISLRSGLRQQGYGQATGTLGLNQGIANSALGLLYGSNAQRFDAAGSMAAAGQSFRQERLGLYNNLGQYRLSGRTKDLIEGGAVGPGSMFEQTGIWRGDTGKWKKRIKENERTQSRTQGDYIRRNEYGEIV